ncbi:hypothetical protein [Nocardia fluminea]|uniref:hypothetical protein n=1 Tax=Nocardia fluminea TaxID=134984 RepID=UPI003D152826
MTIGGDVVGEHQSELGGGGVHDQVGDERQRGQGGGAAISMAARNRFGTVGSTESEEENLPRSRTGDRFHGTGG